ncbi:hypothetical protein FWH09_02575 [Candidatus Saccharibacteria bacterium]|nr:hypothetical protein [Candidatus Saccharibacteria bacterium]
MNYELTAHVIPLVVFGDRDFFVKTILPSPKNMKTFISDAMWGRVCKSKNIPSTKLTITLSARKTATGYHVVFVEFGEEFANMPTESRVIAFASDGSDLRYFTYEMGGNMLDKNTEWFICGWEPIEQGGIRHLNFGSHKQMSKARFAAKVEDLLAVR